MRLEVRAEVHPSEDAGKIKEAIKRIFPDLPLTTNENFVVGKASNLEMLEEFKRRLRQQSIRNSARKALLHGQDENSVKFKLNKQAATMGKVSFTDGETPLGPITVTIKSAHPYRIIDFLAPRPSARDKKGPRL